MREIQKKLAGLSREFESMMNAITFAEAGEFEAAREELQPSRSVVLAASEDTLNQKVFTYAANISKRMDATLRLLFVTEEGSPWDALARCLKKLSGIYPVRGAEVRDGDPLKATVLSQTEGTLRVEIRQGCIRNQIVDYTNEHTGVLFVVLESAEGIASNCMRKDAELESAWNNLGCPLVFVSETEAV